MQRMERTTAHLERTIFQTKSTNFQVRSTTRRVQSMKRTIFHLKRTIFQTKSTNFRVKSTARRVQSMKRTIFHLERTIFQTKSTNFQVKSTTRRVQSMRRTIFHLERTIFQTKPTMVQVRSTTLRTRPATHTRATATPEATSALRCAALVADFVSSRTTRPPRIKGCARVCLAVPGCMCGVGRLTHVPPHMCASGWGLPIYLLRVIVFEQEHHAAQSLVRDGGRQPRSRWQRPPSW